MKITLDLSDSVQVADILDAIVASHLKSSKDAIVTWQSTHPDDVDYDKKVIDAIDVLLYYFTGNDDGD